MKATIYSIKEAAPNRIAIVARPRGGDWLCDELSALSREGIDVLVSMLTEEETNDLGLHRESGECEAAAIKFINLPIPDRSVPSDRDGFLRSVGASCRNGESRTIPWCALPGQHRPFLCARGICFGATWVGREQGILRRRVSSRMLHSRYAGTAPVGHPERSNYALMAG